MSTIIKVGLIAIIIILLGLVIVSKQQTNDAVVKETGSSKPEKSTPDSTLNMPSENISSDEQGSTTAPDISDSAKLPSLSKPQMPSPDSSPSRMPEYPATNSSRQDPVNVPQSYPVERAAEFFIPAEQRSPGNLGGPPPLPAALMNGTSAPPAAPSASGIQPPAAPGN